MVNSPGNFLTESIVIAIFNLIVYSFQIQQPQLLLKCFLYPAAFECNTTSDWLNRMVKPIRSCVTFKFTNLEKKKKKNILENVR